MNCKQKITYGQRKTQKKGCKLRVSPWTLDIYKKGIVNEHNITSRSGKDFNGSDSSFHVQGLSFPDPLWDEKIWTPSTYVYIISKKIDGETYFKIGEGGKGRSTDGTGRLGDAQVFLVPGLENIGFRVHYVLFFRKTFHLNSQFVGQYIEEMIHSRLRNYFPSSNISFANDRASEWYLVNKTAIPFFIGFVFDLVGSNDHDSIAPLQIWKYGEKSQEVTKFRLFDGPNHFTSRTELKKRMMKNDVYKDMVEHLENEFGLSRKLKQVPNIFLDHSDRTDDDKKRLKDAFLKQPQFVLDNTRLTVVDVVKGTRIVGLHSLQLYGIVEDEDGKGKDAFKSNQISVYDASKDGEEKGRYYVHMKDVLQMVKPTRLDERAKWELFDIYSFYTSKEYKQSFQEIADYQGDAIPLVYLHPNIQDYWATKFVDQSSDMSMHEDTSVDNPEDNHKYTWKCKKVQNVDHNKSEAKVILRAIWDTERNQFIENTEEIVPVIRIMMLKQVAKIKKIDKVERWNKTQSYHTIAGVTYKEGDIVEIENDRFIQYHHGLPTTHAKGRRQYKIMRFLHDNFSGDEYQPYMDLQSLEEEDKGRKDFPYISANEKYIEGYIDLVAASEPKKALYTPKYKVSDYVMLKKGKYPLDGSDADLSSLWQKHDHYVQIKDVHVDERGNNYYGLLFFPPYDVPGAWNKAQTSGKYLHTVGDMKRFERATQKVDSFYETIRGQNYEEKLPFLVHNVASIENHVPKRFNRKDMQENDNGYYQVVWNGPIVHTQKQKASLVLEMAKDKVAKYWQQMKTKLTRKSTTQTPPGSKTLKKRSNVQKFAFETFDDELPRAQALWADIANDNTKFEKKNKPAFQRIIHIDERIGKVTRALFRVGDVFVAFLEPETMYYGYLVNHFYKKNERKMSYGVLFSASEDQVIGVENHYAEYYDDDLIELLSEGDETQDSYTLDYLKNRNELYKNGKTYNTMIARYENILKK